MSPCWSIYLFKPFSTFYPFSVWWWSTLTAAIMRATASHCAAASADTPVATPIVWFPGMVVSPYYWCYRMFQRWPTRTRLGQLQNVWYGEDPDEGDTDRPGGGAVAGQYLLGHKVTSKHMQAIIQKCILIPKNIGKEMFWWSAKPPHAFTWCCLNQMSKLLYCICTCNLFHTDRIRALALNWLD